MDRNNVPERKTMERRWIDPSVFPHSHFAPRSSSARSNSDLVPCKQFANSNKIPTINCMEHLSLIVHLWLWGHIQKLNLHWMALTFLPLNQHFSVPDLAGTVSSLLSHPYMEELHLCKEKEEKICANFKYFLSLYCSPDYTHKCCTILIKSFWIYSHSKCKFLRLPETHQPFTLRIMESASVERNRGYRTSSLTMLSNTSSSSSPGNGDCKWDILLFNPHSTHSSLLNEHENSREVYGLITVWQALWMRKM